jgi:hypothetical protein
VSTGSHARGGAQFSDTLLPPPKTYSTSDGIVLNRLARAIENNDDKPIIVQHTDRESIERKATVNNSTTTGANPPPLYSQARDRVGMRAMSRTSEMSSSSPDLRSALRTLPDICVKSTEDDLGSLQRSMKLRKEKVPVFVDIATQFSFCV